MIIIEEARPQELEQIVKENKIVLIEYVSRAKRESRYFHSLIKDFSFKVLNKIKIVTIDLDKYPELWGKENIVLLPCLKLFLNGENIWEQEGCFMDYTKDMLILRRSIREALKRKGLNIRI